MEEREAKGIYIRTTITICGVFGVSEIFDRCMITSPLQANHHQANCEHKPINPPLSGVHQLPSVNVQFTVQTPTKNHTSILVYTLTCFIFSFSPFLLHDSLHISVISIQLDVCLSCNSLSYFIPRDHPGCMCQIRRANEFHVHETPQSLHDTSLLSISISFRCPGY